MTAAQILEKHLLSMIKRTDQSYVSVDEMKQQPEWEATINAMLEYGEMQALRIHDVVVRSEQLRAFVDEFIESWEDGNAGDSDLYRKAKSL
jgi:hypothetical protein